MAPSPAHEKAGSMNKSVAYTEVTELPDATDAPEEAQPLVDTTKV